MNPLEALRPENVTQKEWADAIGLPLRTYEDTVAGKVKTRPVHINAAKYALIVHNEGRKNV